MLKSIREKLSSDMSRDVIWTFSIQILVMLCSFAINKLLANRLSIDDFGQYNVIKRSVQVLSFIMLAGVGIALPRYIPLYRNSQPPRRIMPLLVASMIYIIGVSTAAGLIVMLFSARMQDIIIGQNDNQGLLLIALAYAFVFALSQYVLAYYRGIGNFRWYNGANLGIQLACIVPLILLPVLTTTSVFASWLIMALLFVGFYLGRELWNKRHSLSTPDASFRDSLRTIIKYSSGRMVADFFQFSLSAFPLVYISNTQGLQATAYFAVGITFVSIITPFFSFMGIILLPYVSQAIARHEMAAANRLITRLSLIYAATAISIILVLGLFTEFLTRLLFASDYVVTVPLTRIMILAILPQAAYMLYRNTIDAVSVIPFNAIVLGLCIAAMTAGFMLSGSTTHYACVYLAVSTLQGLLSWLIWQFLRKKALK